MLNILHANQHHRVFDTAWNVHAEGKLGQVLPPMECA